MKHRIIGLILLTAFALEGITSSAKAAQHSKAEKQEVFKEGTAKKNFKQGIFIKGRYILDKAHNEPYFVFQAPKGRLLLLGFDDKLESEMRHQVPGKEIYAFVAVNEQMPEESEVIAFAPIPSDYVFSAFKGVYELKGGKEVASKQSITYHQILEKLEAIPSLQEHIAEEKTHLDKIAGKQDKKSKTRESLVAPAEGTIAHLEELLDSIEKSIGEENQPKENPGASLAVQGGRREMGSILHSPPHKHRKQGTLES